MQNPKIMEDLLFKEECYSVIGMCIRILNKLGKGFKEEVCRIQLKLNLRRQYSLSERKKNSLLHTRESVFLTSLMLATISVN